MKLLVGIPAFNEEKSIATVIDKIPRKIEGIGKVEVLVVDDGSRDRTRDEAQLTGATVLVHLINRGLGGALKTIFAYAREKNYDFLVTCDADGQHDPKDINGIIKILREHAIDVVISSRWRKPRSGMISRYLINLFANVLTFLLFGVWTTDSQSGLRGFTKKAFERITIHSDGMEVSSEFFAEIQRNKLKFVEIPIRAVYTDYSKQKGQRLTNGFHVFLELIIRLLK